MMIGSFCVQHRNNVRSQHYLKDVNFETIFGVWCEVFIVTVVVHCRPIPATRTFTRVLIVVVQGGGDDGGRRGVQLNAYWRFPSRWPFFLVKK
jgi:hypothetical protein